MEFYEVWVSSANFHGKEPLTYSSDESLKVGEVVSVPLLNKQCLGIVKSKVAKPTFKTKSLSNIPSRPIINTENLRLLEWLTEYYPAPLGQITSLFLPSNLNSKSRLLDANLNNKKLTIAPLPNLTIDQEKAINLISKRSPDPIILHGDTGTGKTRVYVELAKKNIESGKSVIVLTPEIGLTPQLVKTFSTVFPGQILLAHSNLTAAKKRDVWLESANSTLPKIIIGPRSALFMPVKNIGLIIVDEFHDGAYKQEQAPHYQTSRVAAKLAKLHNAHLILGSATPNVSDYYTFESKKLPIIRMTQQAIDSDHKLESIDIIPINDRSKFKKSFWISDSLIEKMKVSLSKGNQSLLFLNRRGSARVAMCQNCGWQALCPRCDIPLTYHGDVHKLRCHTCGLNSNAPSACPDCGAADIEFKGIGTKAILHEAQKLFPDARIARFDSDNLKNEKLDDKYDEILAGEIDILVGTQTLTKGLDLPKLSVVGVITADTALYFPDYTAEELTYQQLSQVVGRVGRGHIAGSVAIQTYYPENPALKAIVDKNYSLFYTQQIAEREKFHFPPYFYILKLVCSRKSSKSAENASQKLYTYINDLPLSLEVIGPAPSFKQKQNEMYYWQLIVKAKKRSDLTYIINHLPTKTSYDIDPTNLL